jgi:hypothetical protein
MPLKHGGMLRALACALATVVLLAAKPSRAEEKEPIAVLELGGAAATNMQGEFGFGPSAAVEFEPIKNYLVIEAGLAPLFDRSGHADWDFDVLFPSPDRSVQKSGIRAGRRADLERYRPSRRAGIV